MKDGGLKLAQTNPIPVRQSEPIERGRMVPLEILAGGYDAWAPHYDEDMYGYGYCVPALMVDQLQRYIPDRRVLVLDAGAGSGLVAQALHSCGYRNLVGLDPSMGMLRQAGTKGVYRLRLKMALGAPTALADHGVDAILAAGVFKAGHAPPEALAALVSAVRPEGLIIFDLPAATVAAEVYDRERRRLETFHQWRPVTATGPFNPLPGVAAEQKHAIYVYQASGIVSAAVPRS